MFYISGTDLGIRAPDLVHMDNVTGLIVPNEGSSVLLANGHMIEVSQSKL